MSRQEARVIVATSVTPAVSERLEAEARKQNRTLGGYMRDVLLHQLEKSTAQPVEVKTLQDKPE